MTAHSSGYFYTDIRVPTVGYQKVRFTTNDSAGVAVNAWEKQIDTTSGTTLNIAPPP